MKRISIFIITTALMLLMVPSVAFAQKKDKKQGEAKVLVDDIKTLSFVVKTSDSRKTFVFTGDGGTISADGQYSVKVEKWNPKKQKLSLKIYVFGNPQLMGYLNGYVTCYEGGKCMFNGTAETKQNMGSEVISHFGTVSEGTNSATVNWEGTFEINDIPVEQ